jgi:hypothetical protein
VPKLYICSASVVFVRPGRPPRGGWHQRACCETPDPVDSPAATPEGGGKEHGVRSIRKRQLLSVVRNGHGMRSIRQQQTGGWYGINRECGLFEPGNSCMFDLILNRAEAIQRSFADGRGSMSLCLGSQSGGSRGSRWFSVTGCRPVHDGDVAMKLVYSRSCQSGGRQTPVPVPAGSSWESDFSRRFISRAAAIR